MSVFLDIVGNGNDVFQINWMKILDSEDYLLKTSENLPNNRFIGAGERWFAGYDSNGKFEGFHKARFKVWIV
jgi:hypothetical protein